MGVSRHASSRQSNQNSLTPLATLDNETREAFEVQAKSMSKSDKSSTAVSGSNRSAENDLRLLSNRARKTFANSKFDLFLARWKLIPIWIFGMCAIATSISVVPVLLVEWVPDFEEFGKWIWRVLVVVGFLNAVPFWLALSQWRPAEPLNGKPMGSLPHVDVLIPCYKESTSTVIETIVACQRIEYSNNKMHCYVLDDGASDDLRRSVGRLKKSGLLRFSLTYVRRPTNEGKKGGNLNHWLRRYEDVSGEFFIVLDADMQPFPDMMDILMGHYYGLPAETRERMSFLQAPQWYQNNYSEKKWKDVFNVSEILFYKVLQPAMSHCDCALYVGTLALWNRRSIESIGGFIEGYATEDSVTGCMLNRTRVPGRKDNWVSKYVSLPVAAGETPDSLPALFDQRMRWFYGLIQMFKHHRGYVFASGLRPIQKNLFWVTSASFIATLVNYTLSFSGAMILLSSISYYAFTNTLNRITLWAFWVGGVTWLLNVSVWTFCPGVTFQQAFLSIATAFLYTPVFFATVLRYFFGIKFKLQDTVDQNEPSQKKRRWHTLFIFPLASILLVTGAAVSASVGLIITRSFVPWEIIVQIPLWWTMWMFLHHHSIAAMLGYVYKHDDFYQKEFQGQLSTTAIQRKMEKHAIAIGEHYSSSRGNSRKTNELTSISAGSSHESADGTSKRSKRKMNLHGDGPVLVDSREGDERQEPQWRERYEDVSSTSGSSDQDEYDSSGSLSISPSVRSKLSVVLARRSAVGEELAGDRVGRQRENQTVDSGTISKTGFGFERNFLGRVANLLSLQAYLSSCRGGPATSAITSSEEDMVVVDREGQKPEGERNESVDKDDLDFSHGLREPALASAMSADHGAGSSENARSLTALPDVEAGITSPISETSPYSESDTTSSTTSEDSFDTYGSYS